MTRKRNNKKLLNALLTLLLLVVTVLGGRYILPAFAETSGYSSAVTDLRKDNNFNLEAYPDNPKDYSIQVIQVAESVNGELFLYTYQPCQMTRPLTAMQINMSLTESADGTKLYDLALLNTSGVFGKYKVKDISVSGKTVRYYNITSIYRAWDKEVDESTGNDNTINAVSYEVGQLWTVKTENGDIIYQNKIIEVITVLDKYVGLLRYSNGFNLYTDKCDSHYVAFSTDKQIDELIEADVSYISVDRTWSMDTNGEHYQTEDPQDNFISLSNTDEASNTAGGLWGCKYTWNRIERIDEFISKEDLKESAKTELQGKKWVLRFAETDYTVIYGVGFVEYSTIVSEVTILRLKFKTNGKVYNLGVVDTKQTGSGIPGNNNQDEYDFSNDNFDFWAWLAGLIGVDVRTAKIIFWCVVALAILAIALPVLSLIFPVVGEALKTAFKVVCKGIKYFFIALWWIISLPFRGIAALIRRHKEKKQAKAEASAAQPETPKQSTKNDA